MQDVRKNIIVVFKTFHQSVLFTAIKQLTRGGIVDTVHNAFADLLTIYYISEEKYRSTCDCKLNLCNRMHGVSKNMSQQIVKKTSFMVLS